MATKVYLSGDKVIVDKLSEPPALNIPVEDAKYTFLGVVSHEGSEVTQFNQVSLSNMAISEERNDLVSEIQDIGGTPIGDFEAVKSYLSSFFSRGGSGVVEQSLDPIVDEKSMEFQKFWNAATNSPTLSNSDVLVTGTVYEVSVDGSTDFGDGSISFNQGDWVYSNGTIWTKQQSGAAIASQAEVNTGTEADKSVSPFTNKNFKGVVPFYLNARGEFIGSPGWADAGLLGDIPVLRFARNATERAVYMFILAERFVLSDFDPVFAFVTYSYGAPVATTGDGIVWRLEARYYTDGDIAIKAADETIELTQIITNLIAEADQGFFSFTLDRSLMTSGDRVMFTLSRLGADGADNYNDDIGVGQSGLLIESKTTNP